MSTITQIDLELGGRLQKACDALAENKLRTAAGIFMELAGEINLKAEQLTGLLAPEEEDWSASYAAPPNPYDTPENKVLCGRNVHAWGPLYVEGGQKRAKCLVCGMVNIAPKDPKDPNEPNGGGGPVDLSQYT